MNLPEGELHIITIDRVVEKDCICVEPIQSKPVAGTWTERGEVDSECSYCHGTGKQSARLRGWVEVKWRTHYIADDNVEVRWNYHGLKTFSKLSELIAAVVSAYLRGELPDELSANIKEAAE